MVYIPDYIHNDPEFKELLAIVANEKKIDVTLIEKDYWIMQSLYGLQQLGIEFELKGGTSLSKGFGIINRFSEDIDIHIKTDFGFKIEGKEDKVKEDRKLFYDRLREEISINGVIKVERDHEFDDLEKYRSGGIRLYYVSYAPSLQGLKEGILLEAGFDNVTPNRPVNISSWVLDYIKVTGKSGEYIDNTSKGVLCYHPGYTLIEKLQTIVNKFRKESSAIKPKNFMRQYYDVYCLLNYPEVNEFIGTPEYKAHKKKRFRGADSEIPLDEHPALLLSDSLMRTDFTERYKKTSNLYYQSQPDFEEILTLIKESIHRL